MGKEFLVTLKVKVSDLPDAEREECIDQEFDSGFYDTREEAEEAVPRVSSLSAAEVKSSLTGFFSSLEEYEVQQEVWAGTGEFMHVSELNLLLISPISSETSSPTGSSSTPASQQHYDAAASITNDALSRFDGDGTYWRAKQKSTDDGGTISGRWKAEDKHLAKHDALHRDSVKATEEAFSKNGISRRCIPFSVTEPTIVDEIRYLFSTRNLTYSMHELPENNSVEVVFSHRGEKHSFEIPLPARLVGTHGQQSVEQGLEQYLARYTGGKADDGITEELETGLDSMMDVLQNFGVPIERDEATGAVMLDMSDIRSSDDPIGG